MSGFDDTQHTRYTLIKSTGGKNVGLAFILRGVDVKSEDLFTVGEDLGGDHATDLPAEEIEADLSHIFVGDSASSDSTASTRVTDSSKQASLNLNMHQNASASGMVSSLAEEMLQELGGGRKEGIKRETQVYQEICTKQDVQREQNKQREDLLGCGLVEGKEELDKPGKFGWIREVITHFTKSHITGVKYITPPHPISGIRKRVSTRKEIMEVLEMSGAAAGGELSFRNFNFSARVLGLGPEFEVVRRSMARGSNVVEPQFAKYCKELPMDEKQGYQSYSSCRVECLIENCGAQMNRGRFSKHMQQFHLPDEVCSFCRVEFPASTIKSHQITCAAENTVDQRTGAKRGKDGLAAGRKIRKMEDGMLSISGKDCSSTFSAEPKVGSTLSMAPEVEERVPESKRGGKVQQLLSIRYGSLKYSVKAESSKKMARVMCKLSKMFGSESLVFKVESSGRVVTGEERVEELLGEVLLAN